SDNRQQTGSFSTFRKYLRENSNQFVWFKKFSRYCRMRKVLMGMSPKELKTALEYFQNFVGSPSFDQDLKDDAFQIIKTYVNPAPAASPTTPNTAPSAPTA